MSSNQGVMGLIPVWAQIFIRCVDELKMNHGQSHVHDTINLRFILSMMIPSGYMWTHFLLCCKGIYKTCAIKLL